MIKSFGCHMDAHECYMRECSDNPQDEFIKPNKFIINIYLL